MSSRQYQVLTAVGRDRPGLVEKISSLLLGAGANLEDSRMAILGGEFALILLFSGTEQAVSLVAKHAETIARELGLRITLAPTERRSATSDFLPYKLEVGGVDRPGIVARVSSLLAGHQINVAALESRVTYAPLSGTPMFQLEAELEVPSKTGLSRLRSQLGELCEEENLDFWLESGRGS
jgi:glycine cleavage system transcriptional repressor